MPRAFLVRKRPRPAWKEEGSAEADGAGGKAAGVGKYGDAGPSPGDAGREHGGYRERTAEDTSAGGLSLDATAHSPVTRLPGHRLPCEKSKSPDLVKSTDSVGSNTDHVQRFSGWGEAACHKQRPSWTNQVETTCVTGSLPSHIQAASPPAKTDQLLTPSPNSSSTWLPLLPTSEALSKSRLLSSSCYSSPQPASSELLSTSPASVLSPRLSSSTNSLSTSSPKSCVEVKGGEDGFGGGLHFPPVVPTSLPGGLIALHHAVFSQDPRFFAAGPGALNFAVNNRDRLLPFPSPMVSHPSTGPPLVQPSFSYVQPVCSSPLSANPLTSTREAFFDYRNVSHLHQQFPASGSAISIPSPASSIPISAAGSAGGVGNVFRHPPSVLRPIPTSWPIQPVPLRAPPMGIRPDFGVMSPEEVPSPPGDAVADMPTSPLVGVRSPGLDAHHALRGFADTGPRPVDLNNNHGNIPSSNFNNGLVTFSSSCLFGGGIAVDDTGSDDGDKGREKSQSFKKFLESAKVRVEMINDGNGMKNPLLCPEKSRLPLDNGSLNFMTMESFPACPVCGLKCDTPRLLQRHVRSHKEIKRYLCAWCGKGFNDTFDLKRHTRTHTGVRPYKCESCGKAFTQRCSLESHCRKIHGQTLPFTFNERRAKLYVCEECGFSTSNIEDHFRHLRAQHPGHPALGRSHHDRRQYKFQGGEDGDSKDGGSDVGYDVRVGEEGSRDGGFSEGESWEGNRSMTSVSDEIDVTL